MMRTKDIEELATLLAHDERLEAKVNETRVILARVKKKISESLVNQYVKLTEEEMAMPEELIREEQSYERLLQALLEMKNEITNRIRPVEEQVIQASVEHLRQTFADEKNRLGECVQHIDKKILECQRAVEEHARIREGLYLVNDKLTRLGAEPLATPEALDSGDLGEILRERVQSLRSQGKL